MSAWMLRRVVWWNGTNGHEDSANSISAMTTEAVRSKATYPSTQFSVTSQKTPMSILVFVSFYYMRVLLGFHLRLFQRNATEIYYPCKSNTTTVITPLHNFICAILSRTNKK
jgi:hypothetical protein